MRYAAAGISLNLPAKLATKGMEPLEQGGILLGDSSAGQVETFTTPGPLDVRLEELFMLLDDCHQETLEASGLDYLGFWHTHPVGTPSDYSLEDLQDWQEGAVQMFAQLPNATHFYYPIVTGDRLRVWAMDRALNLTELHPEEVTPCSIPTLQP
ncbi:Mov34/MPN/PAD-1 family protein [Deinococcus ruber]|uniref:JAB domain-containing protein n=1 Tax=Deinococcus ruber TaxID=1848197 RepID=A0A918FEZ1_9DEIO|nr:Mov34/MPN/PAD-1 family protein [Deinococcus ruber]GGR31390.1 hypothetical protein GCM10008957_47620 [Deinococcus ruber]